MKNSKWSRMLGIAFLLLMSITACKDDPPGVVGHELPPYCILQITDEVAFSLSYEMTTATFITTQNETDKELMTPAEKALSIPKPEYLKVCQMIKRDGLVNADIELTRFEENPEFPERMLGYHEMPNEYTTKRIQVRNSVSTHYNEDGEVIVSEQYETQQTTAFIQQMVEGIMDTERLSDEEMEAMIQAFSEADFGVESEPDFPNIAVITVVHNDQSQTKIFLDKELQVVRGRDEFASTGELETSSHFIFNEAGETVGHWFATYYESPFTGNPMIINKVSEFTNLATIVNP